MKKMLFKRLNELSEVERLNVQFYSYPTIILFLERRTRNEKKNQ